MKTWNIPVSWEVQGVIQVEADTLEEAIEIAKTDDMIPLPEDSEYIPGSWQVCEDEYYTKEWYN